MNDLSLTKRVIALMLILFALGLLGCGKKSDQNKKNLKSYQVNYESVNKSLYFSGTIQPLNESAMTSPVDATIEKMNCHFGQWVKKGEPVMTLRSDELQKQYNETLTEYLKAKDAYAISETKFNGTQALWDAGLLSKNNYLSEKSSFDSSKITLMESTRKLHKTLEKMNLDVSQDLSSLTLAEFDKVRQALAVNHHTITLKAPVEGILLYPTQSTDSNKNGKLNVGSSIKAGEVVGLIGDLSGVSVEIDVPEVDIDKIHPGMDAQITGVAFGKQMLKGKLVAMNAQATQSSGGGLPSFHALIEVKPITEKQREWIRIGMTATILLSTEANKQLMIPIAAVKRENGNSTVQVKGADGLIQSKAITTGTVEMDKVVVLNVLKQGDTIVYE